MRSRQDDVNMPLLLEPLPGTELQLKRTVGREPRVLAKLECYQRASLENHSNDNQSLICAFDPAKLPEQEQSSDYLAIEWLKMSHFEFILQSCTISANATNMFVETSSLRSYQNLTSHLKTQVQIQKRKTNGRLNERGM
eukprot:g36411.t1